MFGAGSAYVTACIEENAYLVSVEPNQVAAFIMKYKWKEEIIFINTEGDEDIKINFGFIFSCKNKEYLMTLREVLIPMQLREKRPPRYKPYILSDSERSE